MPKQAKDMEKTVNDNTRFRMNIDSKIVTNFWQNKLRNRIIVHHHQVGFLLGKKEDSTYDN
jgi:hypothetical protein